MGRQMNRRQALGAFGTVSLGALLAACGGAGEATTATVSTTEGSTTTVEPRTPSSSASDLAKALDDAGSCAQTVEQTEGPYYFDADSIRSDIREDRDGTRLRLGIRVRHAAECTPIANAVVDVWHCDAGGVYPGFYASAPYAARGQRSQLNDSDGIYDRSLLLTLSDDRDGYLGLINFDVAA
jgi:protocatechuate 3,4-dioxygenase beta subunit